MMWEALGIDGTWAVTPKAFGDDRGRFMEAFKFDVFEQQVGHPFTVAQVNVSTSKAGVVRGIHFSQLPLSQAKYVTCMHGAVLDVIVDLRLGSPTFGKHQTVLLDSRFPRAVYISEGLGHAFMALKDDSTVAYMVSTGYAPEREFGVAAFDPTIGIEWPTTDLDGNPLTPTLSAKDMAAPSLTSAVEQGILPDFDEVMAYRRSLRRS